MNRELYAIYNFILIALITYLFYVTHNEKRKKNLKIVRFYNDIDAKQSNMLHVKNENKINACLFILIRNRELKEWLTTMQEFEQNFNKRYNYPYVFMNDVPFAEEFKSAVLNVTKAKVEFGLIPKEHWSIPPWIDQDLLQHKLNTSLARMWSGTMMSYHHMCRYYSGFFFRSNLTLKYDYFWRLEPKVNYPAKLNQDPFQTLIDNNKIFGFSITRPELMSTIPTLWNTIRKWFDTGYGMSLASNNAIGFISDDNGDTLRSRTCTFFNNFEIGAFSVFRDQKYLDYFDYLDKSGGFFYERWGDSAIHTFYVVLMLDRRKIHMFDDIAYFHPPRYYCPPKEKNFNASCDLELLKQCETIYCARNNGPKCKLNAVRQCKFHLCPKFSNYYCNLNALKKCRDYYCADDLSEWCTLKALRNCRISISASMDCHDQWARFLNF